MAVELIAGLKRRLSDCSDENLLRDLLETAEGVICAYTGRKHVPDALRAAQLEIACMLYNRMGMEGESAHSEGGLSYSAESLPELLRRQLNPFRLARTVDACS